MLCNPQANSTDCGFLARDGATMSGYAFFIWGMAFSENRFTLFRAMP
jgi:hypothetical protein